ncbi:MAG: hypothetical protein GDA49_05800 [Rhodospirillales bacterium]|nr:hypothetical protein [Rhodospirillales bacterium]
MRLNPELRRYLWLELSLGRLLFMPLVIGLLAALIGVTIYDNELAFGGPDFLGTIVWAGLAIYIVLLLFWGARVAASALVREIAERTWDQQRLSSMDAWSMTWGKLFGSTVYVWYALGIVLAIVLGATALLEIYFGDVSEEVGGSLSSILARMAIGLVALTVLVEATVMLAAMTAVSQRETARQLDVSIAQIIVILSALFAYIGLQDLEQANTMPWYGETWNSLSFVVGSTVIFALWAVVGLWRRMREELQIRNWPLMWPLFVLWSGFWLAGLMWPEDGHDGMTVTIVVMTVTVLVSTYVPAALERMDPVRLRRLFAARDLSSVLRDAPIWVVGHILALVGVVISVVMLLGIEMSDDSALAALAEEIDLPSLAAMSLVSAYFFVTRDLLLLIFTWLGKRPRRAFATWLIWMALLYSLIPTLVSLSGGYQLLPAFVPIWDVPFVDLAVPPALWPLGEVVLVGLLLRWRWRRFRASAVSG